VVGAYCLMRVFADPGDEARLRRSRFYEAVADAKCPRQIAGTQDPENAFQILNRAHH